MLRAFGHHAATCCVLLAQIDHFQAWANNTQHVTTCRNTAGKRTQHVALNNVAICCVGMLRPFGRGFRELVNSDPQHVWHVLLQSENVLELGGITTWLWPRDFYEMLFDEADGRMKHHLNHSRPHRPHSFWTAPRVVTSDRTGFSEHAQSNRCAFSQSDLSDLTGLSVNRWLPVLDQPRVRH